MNRDRIEGGWRNLRGRGRTALGAVGGRPRPQMEGAYEQVAGVAQSAYGRVRDRAETLGRDGRDLADETIERGRRYGRDASRGGRALVARAEENRLATLALAGLAVFGLGWLFGRSR